MYCTPLQKNTGGNHLQSKSRLHSREIETDSTSNMTANVKTHLSTLIELYYSLGQSVKWQFAGWFNGLKFNHP